MPNVRRATSASRTYGGKTADERRAERRAALIAAGLAIWQEQGWAAVTMRGVCAASGVGDRYFYENFRDRDDLLAHIWTEVRDDTLLAVASAITADGIEGPYEQLRVAIESVAAHVADRPAHAQILFGDHGGSAVLEQLRREAIRLATDLMIELAGPYLRDGIDPEEFRLNVIVGIGGFVEAMLIWRAGMLDLTPEGIADHLTTLSMAWTARFVDAPAPR